MIGGPRGEGEGVLGVASLANHDGETRGEAGGVRLAVKDFTGGMYGAG